MKLLFENWRRSLKEARRKQDLNPWYKEYDRLKKVFIKKEILSRQKQIKNIMHDKLIRVSPSRYDAKNIINDIVRLVQATPVSFVDNPVRCKNVHGQVGPACYYHGPMDMYRRAAAGKIIVSQFSSYWLKNGPKHHGFATTIFHELGHAKEEAINAVFGLRLHGGGSYSKVILKRTKKCFPGLKVSSHKHHEMTGENYASLAQLRGRMGRPFNRSDIELVCAYRKFQERGEKVGGPEWDNYSTLSVRWDDGGDGKVVAGDLLSNEIWRTFSCQKCGPGSDIDFAAELMNDLIARFEGSKKYRMAEQIRKLAREELAAVLLEKRGHK